MRVRARWQSVVDHECVIDVPDGMSPDDYLTPAVLSAEEDDLTVVGRTTTHYIVWDELD